MKKIQMVDLKSQYEKIKEEVDAGIQEVIDSCAFVNGPAVHGFQADLEKYLGVKHVIPCANGTDALQVSMMALGLKPGDEVITTSFTFIATAEVIALLGLTPVLVDVEADTMNIDPLAVQFQSSGYKPALRVKERKAHEIAYRLDVAVESFNRKVETNSVVFVHCAMGMSRSATTVIMYLMKKFGISVSEVSTSHLTP